MPRPLVILHAAIALAWAGAALALALGIALSGNQAAALAAQRGADLKTRMELAQRQERVKAMLDYEASAPHLADAVRRLDLPLSAPPPTRFAAR